MKHTCESILQQTQSVFVLLGCFWQCPTKCAMHRIRLFKVLASEFIRFECVAGVAVLLIVGAEYEQAARQLHALRQPVWRSMRKENDSHADVQVPDGCGGSALVAMGTLPSCTE